MNVGLRGPNWDAVEQLLNRGHGRGFARFVGTDDNIHPAWQQTELDVGKHAKSCQMKVRDSHSWSSSRSERI